MHKNLKKIAWALILIEIALGAYGFMFVEKEAGWYFVMPALGLLLLGLVLYFWK